MKTTLLLSLLVAASATTILANAQTYQWKDSKGRTVISDTPPPGSAKAQQTIGAPQPSSTTTPSDKVPEAAKTTAEKDLEFRKRQQDAKEKAEKEAKEQAVATEKRENCEQARRSLATLESSQAAAQFDETGQRKVLDNGQREQEIERVRKIIADSCK